MRRGRARLGIDRQPSFQKKSDELMWKLRKLTTDLESLDVGLPELKQSEETLPQALKFFGEQKRGDLAFTTLEAARKDGTIQLRASHYTHAITACARSRMPLRLPRGRQPAAPAATTRAAAPSGGSGYCACREEDSQRHQRRQRAPQPLLEALGTAPATRKTASGTSGDNPRRSPFWRLWVLRLPRGRQPAAPAATTRAAAPSGGSWVLRLPRRQPAAPAATTRAAAPSEALGTAPATRKTASGTSGDNPRRSPFWRLWVLRLPRRQPAAPAATTRAAASSGGSGYCACHEEDSQRHQRRQRAPQPLLAALGTAPATRHQRRQRAPQPLLGGSGYCACHEEDSKRHQRRQRAPQPLL